LKELLGIWPEPLSGAKLAKLARDLGRLASQGLVRPSWRLDERGVGLRYEMWLSAVPRAALEGVRLGPKEKELYALLEGAPPTPLSHYRAIMPDPLAQAKSLARKGLVAIESRERFRDDPGRALSVDHQKVESLTAEQEAAMAAIGPALAEGGNHAFLLFGVTGSGKTEIYLRAAELALSAGKGVLWLAPEIALTMGLEGRLKSRFPALPISVLHSGLTPGQRHDHWMALRRGRSRLALGARSAVFAPVAGLGLVVVDEEHDWAYKQDDGLRYNGRDLAAWRAREAGSALILGSATPSLESYHGALTGRLRLLRMESRPGASVMPEVIIVDRRGESGRSPLAAEVRASMREAFGRGEQALMFINRRGMANVPKCLSCGEALKCPHCDLSLTLHGRGADPRALREDEAGEPALHAPLGPEHRLVCHGCGYRAWPPKRCPNCQSELVRYMGIGTQSLAKLVEKDFGKKGLRLDTDSAKAKGGLKGILESFAKGEADFLVGTQMAAKGHDFSHLTMVGVVDADLGLNWPDFRAAERTFQLLSQVSGRAGRREAPGKVYIQTRNPGHYSMVAARDHDYELFFQKEIAIRQELGYPPFARLALIRLSGPDEGAVSEAAERAAEAGRAIIGGAPPEEVEIFGPAPAHVAKLRERYRYQIMLRSRTAYERHRVLLAWTPGVRKGLPEEVIMTVDVDPYDLP
jgi:primosomal protein N' (replication factor Y)